MGAAGTTKADEAEIICERRGYAGLVTLNRPRALNALTLTMVRGLAAALDRWEHDSEVRHVVVTGAGERAFSAGGDIRSIFEAGRAGDYSVPLRFWAEEYTLNRRIRRYGKPYIAVIDGIVMGGGVGVSVHGSHRIAGDRYAFAMPEVGIGFFPDVGATYVLPRCLGKTGTYLALTGGRAKTGDGIALGLATHYVPSPRIVELRQALVDEPDAQASIAAFSSAPPVSPLSGERSVIDRCFEAATIEEIIQRLEMVMTTGSDFAGVARQAILAKSPTSLGIALRQMRIGPTLDFDEAMRTEYRVAWRICRGHDFYEGIRAVIIDKDNQPAWRPATIAEVDSRDIEAHFAALGPGELNFPDPSPPRIA